jgi:hypothetical protein
MTNLGNVQARTGDYPAAVASQERALRMFRDLSDRRGQAQPRRLPATHAVSPARPPRCEGADHHLA